MVSIVRDNAIEGNMMVLEYDFDKLNEVLSDFHFATGINVSLLDENFNMICMNEHSSPDYCRAIQSQNPNERPCGRSDLMLLKQCQLEKKPVKHVCHAGLLDISVPILCDESILGYVIFGQIRTNMEFSEIKERILRLRLNMDEMEKFYGNLRYIDDCKICSIASIAEILARHIVLENMIKPVFCSEIERAIAFIHANLCRHISIKEICAHSHLSTSTLYRQFQRYFGCTVSQYINTRRIEKAVKLLKKTQLSIDNISEQLGFSDPTYFSRIFRQKIGISPMQYRKQIRSTASSDALEKQDDNTLIPLCPPCTDNSLK